MPVLSDDARLRVTKCLLDGCSIRATERITDVHRDTIMRLGVALGDGCAVLHDRLVRGLRCAAWQLDEAWTFVAVKQARAQMKHGPDAGDQYVFIALDPASKLIGSVLVGRRDGESTNRFVADLKTRLDVSARPLVTTDGWEPYVHAIELAFAETNAQTGEVTPAVEYGMCSKNYRTGSRRGPDHRYEPPREPFIVKTLVFGDPDPAKLSTSLVEVQNRLLRQSIRRMTRLTNAYSKKKRSLDAAVNLHTFWYNFGRHHSAIRCTPAMAVGVSGHAWTHEEMIAEALTEAAKIRPGKAADEPPAQLELPFHDNAGGPKGPQLDLFTSC